MLSYLFSAKVNAFFLVVALASDCMMSSDSFVEYMVAMIFPTRVVNILKAWLLYLGETVKIYSKAEVVLYNSRTKMLLYTTLIKNAYLLLLTLTHPLPLHIQLLQRVLRRTTRKVAQIVIVFGHVD